MKFITLKSVAGIGNISRATAWRYSQYPDFPQPLYFSPGRKVWIEQEVLDWFLRRPRIRFL